MMDCKKALDEARGRRSTKAVKRILREKGVAKAGKRPGRRPRRASSRPTSTSPATATSRVGVLVEVNCETDFVARNESSGSWRTSRAADRRMNPQCRRREDIPDEGGEEPSVSRPRPTQDGKPAQASRKIVESQVENF